MVQVGEPHTVSRSHRDAELIHHVPLVKNSTNCFSHELVLPEEPK